MTGEYAAIGGAAIGNESPTADNLYSILLNVFTFIKHAPGFPAEVMLPAINCFLALLVT
jgi:hypothetical protein